MPASQTPHTVALYVHEELVDKMRPGDRVSITGIYRGVPLRVTNRQRTLKAVYKTYIDVLHFRYHKHSLFIRFYSFRTFSSVGTLLQAFPMGTSAAIFSSFSKRSC